MNILENFENRSIDQGNSEDEIRESLRFTPRMLPYQRFYIDYHLFAPMGSGPTVPFCIKLQDPGVPSEAIAEALLKVFRHFAAFGSVFEFAEDGELCLVHRPEQIKPIEILHLSEEDALRVFIQDLQKPVPVVNRLPYRCKLCVVNDHLYIFYIVFHHAILDAGSIMNMWRALDDMLAGKELWPDEYYCYLLRMDIMRQQSKSVLEKRSEKYCGDSYDRIPRFDHTCPGREISTRYFPVSIPFSKFKKRAKEANASASILFSAAGLLALREYNRSDRVRINWVYHGRSEKWMKNIVGITMASIPVAVDFDSIQDCGELLDEIKRQNSENVQYAGLSAGLADHSPGATDSLTMIYNGGVTHPGKLFENASEIFLFDKYKCSRIAMLMECVFLADPKSDTISIAINWSKSVYEDKSVCRFADILVSTLTKLGSLGE